MKYLKLFSLVLSTIFVLSACEDQIVIDLDNTAPRVVIDAVITDQPGPYFVKITKSSDYYEPNVFAPIVDAKVTITDDQGNSETLIETNDGIYSTQNLQGIRGVTYTLDVVVDGKKYTAQNRIPLQVIEIDSLSYKFEDGESTFYDEGYYFSSHFLDPINVNNYYRANVFVNGKVYDFKFDEPDKDRDFDDNFWLANDKFSDGKYRELNYPHKLAVGDVVTYELHHLSESTYNYYRTLVDVIRGSGVAPANPITNFGDGALGYFGAYSIAYKTLKIN